ncbi:hypothetical protein SAMN05216304_106217 [Bosea sp. OK403]|nr:hypothetical protein SAMN05216304_106217 [Bosea sp. OK403]
MTMSLVRTVTGAVLLLATLLAGCQSVSQETAPRLGGKAEPYARSWAEPGSPRPDLPPDRDGRNNKD